MPKRAVFNGSGTDFEIVDSMSGRTMYAGTFSDFGFDAASGFKVKIADFSGFNRTGKYFVRAGRKCSAEFSITDKPYTDLKDGLLKAFYYNRCGELDSAYAAEYTHGVCHEDDAMLYDDPAATLDVRGGWHSSNNYGRYTAATCVAIAHMLYAFRLFPDAFANSGNIPGGKKNLPDILEECRYGLDWLLKMQASDGGVYHKVSSLNSNLFVTCDDDNEPMYIFPCSHQATAYFIAVTALASGIYEKYDPDFADFLQSAAFNGWIWLCGHENYKPFGNKYKSENINLSDIPDNSFTDAFFWVICELYALTGDDVFRSKITEVHKKANVTGFELGMTGGFGALAYMLSDKPHDLEVERAIRLQFRIASDNLCSVSERNGFDTVMAEDGYKLGSNISILADSMTLVTAYIMLNSKSYLHTAQEQFNYILGKNPNDICFVTGFGTNTVTQPHHRQSAFDDVEKPIPGMVVIGANADRDDDYAKWNIPKDCPPARCYCDTGFCSSTNETSVICNSSALWLAAFFETI